VRYTPGQLRNATGIAPETFRHWKKALGPLRSERGHSPCFSAGDLLAVAVVRVLTMDLGLRVGALSPVAEALFDICNASPWPALERSNLILIAGESRVLLVPELEPNIASDLRVIVALRPIVALLRMQLEPVTEDVEQPLLRFPLYGLAAGSGRS